MEKKLSPGGYIPGIDGLRAAAVLAVILFHMDISPVFRGGFTGVDIFFVISGYVIARSLHSRSNSSFREYISVFYKRRILRILPALVVCLLITFLTTVLFIPETWLNNLILKGGLASFFGVNNITHVILNDGYFAPRNDFNPFLHTWSLAVEEQFYMIFPLLYYLWMRRKQSGRTAAGFTGSLLWISAAASLAAAVIETGTSQPRAFYLLHSRFWELAAGAILWQFHSSKRLIPGTAVFSRILILTGSALMITGFFFTDPQAFPFPWALLPVTASLLVLSGLSGRNFTENAGNADHPVPRIFGTLMLEQKPVRYIGKISYSLYLWHWPVAAMLRWTTGLHTPLLKIMYLAGSIILAVLSYHFLEQPIRHNRALISSKSWKIIIAGAAVLVLGYFGSKGLVEAKPYISLSVTRDSYIWRSGRYWRDREENPVPLSSDYAGRQLFALGDSHTSAYRTMLNIISRRMGIETYEYEAGGCAVAGLLRPMTDGGESHYLNALSEISVISQPGDIVFLASLRMPELSSRFELVNVVKVLDDFFSEEAAEGRSIALKEADTIIRQFEELGLRVVIAAPEPVLLIPPYRCSDWFNWTNPIAKPGRTISRELLMEIRSPIMNSLEVLQTAHPDLVIWDPMEVLCTEEVFSAFDDNGLPIFYDGDHLSGNGNRILAPSFQETLEGIWALNG